MGDVNNFYHDIFCDYLSLNDDTFRRDGRDGKCPLCLRMEKSFYCTECVYNGNFTHSKTKSLERFADKKVRMYKIREEKSKLLQRYAESLSSKIKAENMKREIFFCTERIRLLKDCIKHNKEELHKGEKRVKDIQIKNEFWHQMNTNYGDKIKQMDKKMKDDAQQIQKVETLLKCTHQSLQSVICEDVQELVKCIFPITEIRTCKRESDFSVNDFSELEDAQQMIYEASKWKGIDNCDDLEYAVNEPCIPANGNYSAYSVWVQQQEENLQSSEGKICQRNFAVDISAALCFTAHLVLVLAYYLDVHVPNRLCYSEFCGHELREHQFLHKVAKLNANIVHLCLSQKVDPSYIHPCHTIPNLLLLLNPETSELGRVGPIDVNSDLMQMMEDSLSKNFLPMEENENGDDDDSDLSTFDWVDLSGIGFSEEKHISSEEQSQASANYVPVTSLAGELISSVALMWRAATGQK